MSPSMPLMAPCPQSRPPDTPPSLPVCLVTCPTRHGPLCLVIETAVDAVAPSFLKVTSPSNPRRIDRPNLVTNECAWPRFRHTRVPGACLAQFLRQRKSSGDFLLFPWRIRQQQMCLVSQSERPRVCPTITTKKRRRKEEKKEVTAHNLCPIPTPLPCPTTHDPSNLPRIFPSKKGPKTAQPSPVLLVTAPIPNSDRKATHTSDHRDHGYPTQLQATHNERLNRARHPPLST
ncbi:hypothetical protein CDEST_06595 [Colletotrichum destructivum]|uniref:Uncharacterized protein n=1 Tax=Colletotrichum destructivum TaxID=34406 RepID=A0AAX4IF31_9PEZI|nr:hypothetical protein CDEST_06595 [Colletotrichum destructivum]